MDIKKEKDNQEKLIEDNKEESPKKVYKKPTLEKHERIYEMGLGT